MANRAVQMVSQIAQYAVILGKAEFDPVLHMRKALPRTPRPTHMPAVLDRDEIGKMLADVWRAPPSLGRALAQLAALLFQRPGEIAGMKWADVSFDDAIWKFRVSKVSLNHAVPLAPEALGIIESLRPWAGRSPYVLASREAKSGHVSTASGMKFMRSVGWGDRQSLHGFRATARTLAAEDLAIAPAVIEAQLSHGVADPLGRAYNRTLFLPQRRQLMERYAEHLMSRRAKAEAGSPRSSRNRENVSALSG